MTATAVRLRRILFERVPAEAFNRINMTALTKATARLNGWTADDIASQILGDYGDGDPAALIVARLNRLDGPPPHDHTPTPDPYDDTERQYRIANAATPEQRAHWISAIRATIHAKH